MARSLTGLLLAVSIVACATEAGRELAITPRESRTIGCSDCRGPELLSAVGLALADDGTVLVLNEYEPFVRIFDGSGTVLRTAGEKGRGPGELGGPGRIYVNSDKSFVLHDYMPPRFFRFAENGEFIGTVSHPVRLPISTDYDPVSNLVYMVNFEVMGDGSAQVESVPMDGSEIRVVLTADRLPATPPEIRNIAGNFALAVAPTGELAVGHRETYRIRTYDSEGNLISEFGRDIPRQLRSEAELAEQREALLGGEPEPEKPHFGRFGIQYDDRGRLWILTDRGGPDETIFDLFARGGSYLGSISLEAEALTHGLQVFDVREDELAVIVYDDDGNTVVKVWEIELRSITKEGSHRTHCE